MWRPVQWRIQGGGLIVRPDPPPLLLSTDCESLDNVCTVFVSLFRDWTVKSVSQGIYSITIRVFCLLKTVSKCTQTYHFRDKNDFFLGRGPCSHLHHTQWPHPFDSYGALLPPYWNPKYATGPVCVGCLASHLWWRTFCTYGCRHICWCYHLNCLHLLLHCITFSSAMFVFSLT